MTAKEFWRLTPALFFELWQRWDEEQERADYRAAQIVCVIANVNRGKNKPPAKIQDFMPKRDRKKTKEGKKPKQTVDEQIAMARKITLAFGGTVKVKGKKP